MLSMESFNYSLPKSPHHPPLLPLDTPYLPAWPRQCSFRLSPCLFICLHRYDDHLAILRVIFLDMGFPPSTFHLHFHVFAFMAPASYRQTEARRSPVVEFRTCVLSPHWCLVCFPYARNSGLVEGEALFKQISRYVLPVAQWIFLRRICRVLVRG